MQKDKNLRQENAQIFAEELEKFWQRAEIKPTGRQTRSDREKNPERQTPKLAAILIIAVSAGIIGWFGAWFFYNQLIGTNNRKIVISIVSPGEMAKKGELEVASKTEKLQVRGKITGAVVTRLLLDDGEIDWQPRSRSFQADLYLRYGQNRRRIWVLTKDGSWVEEKWLINRRPPTKDTAKASLPRLPANPKIQAQEKAMRAIIDRLIANHCPQ